MSAAPIRRLPVQHPLHPHCPECERALPTFRDVNINVGGLELKEAKLVSLTFRVRCKCGAAWDLEKKVRG